MSFFAGKPFAGAAYAKPAAADPAQEIQRLLNSYSNNWVQLEKGIQEVKAKQEQAQQEYHKHVQEVYDAKLRLLGAEEARATNEAACDKARQDLQARQDVHTKLAEELAQATSEEEEMRCKVDKDTSNYIFAAEDLLNELSKLKQDNPGAFFTS